MSLWLLGLIADAVQGPDYPWRRRRPQTALVCELLEVKKAFRHRNDANDNSSLQLVHNPAYTIMFQKVPSDWNSVQQGIF